MSETGLGLGSLAGVRSQDSSWVKAEGRPSSADNEIQQTSLRGNWLLICSLGLNCRSTSQVSPTPSIRTSMGTWPPFSQGRNRCPPPDTPLTCPYSPHSFWSTSAWLGSRAAHAGCSTAPNGETLTHSHLCPTSWDPASVGLLGERPIGIMTFQRPIQNNWLGGNGKSQLNQSPSMQRPELVAWQHLD